MAEHKTEAILLRSIDVGETDRIVHLLTPDLGRVTAMAKSARKSVKRFPGTLDLMNHLNVELQIRPRRMTHIGRAKLISPFLELRNDASRFAMGCYLVELLGRLAPEGSAGGDARCLFDFSLGAMHHIEALEPNPKTRLFLKLESLCALGLRPELRQCVSCGEELAGFKELVPEPRWSEEDFLQRFGHHLHHSTHAQAFADLDLDNDRLLSHEVGPSLCLPAPLLQLLAAALCTI